MENENKQSEEKDLYAQAVERLKQLSDETQALLNELGEKSEEAGKAGVEALKKKMEQLKEVQEEIKKHPEGSLAGFNEKMKNLMDEVKEDAGEIWVETKNYWSKIAKIISEKSGEGEKKEEGK